MTLSSLVCTGSGRRAHRRSRSQSESLQYGLVCGSVKRKYYDSDLSLSAGQDKYRLGRAIISFYDRGIKEPVELKEMVDFMGR
ncbi:MAG: hypothetical protein IPL69_20300 [Saprospiraceae bacterium]|nr:hypothetical protein [Candidatus Brachybacter algidus]